MRSPKSILAWTEDDLELLRNDPYNLEDMNIEYKEQYRGDPDELRRDIVSFANSEWGGYLLFGIRDDPFELIGIVRGEVDHLKNTINHISNSNIDPHLDPPPILNPIYLSNGLYILGIQIIPKEKGLYGIRRNNNPNALDFYFYSFWVRSDGCKRMLSMNEVNSYMLRNYDDLDYKGIKDSQLMAMALHQDDPFFGETINNFLQLKSKYGKKSRKFKKRSR